VQLAGHGYGASWQRLNACGASGKREGDKGEGDAADDVSLILELADVIGSHS
jgi:hypothetical protein